MADPNFETNVFINCPFDEEFAPLLEAALFCVVYFGFTPRLANERLENGENRLEKIVSLIDHSRYSIHDLSKCRAMAEGEFQRMNMPFEYGMDLGFRRIGKPHHKEKKHLIFEENPYDLKRALSDIAGQDVEFHRNNYELVIRKVRDFFRVEVGVDAPGPARLVTDYITFQGWMIEKKIHEGHSEREAVNLPTQERLEEMQNWVKVGKPVDFEPLT
ncbi:MAG: hypothetical protein AAGA08_11105 [Pseudomonadota bacterium]